MMVTAQRALRYDSDSTILEAANSGKITCTRDHKEALSHKAVISAEPVKCFLKGSTSTVGLIANMFSLSW